MFVFVLASAAAAAQPADWVPRSGATVQARASVRILSGERIRLDDSSKQDGDSPFRRRDTTFVIDGKPVAASFVEFE